uniref:Rhophilin Rho GTPase binding protein 2 n=1 Tax=Chelonoidis abingdonii TaxID=106734 RepID=A0A8C0H751_CHEAB
RCSRPMVAGGSSGQYGPRPAALFGLEQQTADTGSRDQQNLLEQQVHKSSQRCISLSLCRATTNNKVREQALLELSFVNSDLQILKEELEGLNISVEVYQNTGETFSIPLIPLGLKETKEGDFTIPLKACRTPSRDESGIEMLMSYFIQLGFVENRFFPPTRQMGILFTWYDSFTGVPVCQQNLLLEKASILFNIGALYTQIGTRCNRQTKPGLENAVDAFQRAAGILNYLKETFTHTPSYDMSPAMLSVLVKMMLAQAQECVFEQISLPGIRNEFFTLVKMAQEVAKVGEVYTLVNTAMNQAPVKANIPYSWSNMAKIKSDHYKALAHYFVATLLSDHHEITYLEECFQNVTTYSLPTSPSALHLPEGKAHLRKAIVYHEEALRVCGLCKKLRNIDILQEILTVAHKRSLIKYAQHEQEDDFLSLMEASSVLRKYPQLKIKGPLPVFSAKQRWTVPRTINFHCQERGLGFTLKGGPPVQVHCLDPECSAALKGLKEGDYIVSINGLDSKWLEVNDVLEKFKSMRENDIEIKVISSSLLTIWHIPSPAFCQHRRLEYNGIAAGCGCG